MFDPQQFKHLVVEPSLIHLAVVLPGADNSSAVNLLMGTCWHESLGGTYLAQVGGGPALGVYQMEPATHDDLWENYIDGRPALASLIGLADTWRLISDLQYATMMARLVYYRQSFDWPDPADIYGLGKLWKTHYNTIHGAGTVDQFVRHYPK